MNRRHFIEKTFTGAAALSIGTLVSDAQTALAQTNSPYVPAPGEVARKRGPQDLHLVYAARDWGGGDWETALGGASHTGHREIALYLLSQGARIDSYCAAMLGE